MKTILQRVCDRLCRYEKIATRAWRHWRVAKSLRRFTPPHRLHLACGRVRFDGWINVDLIPIWGVADLAWDITEPLPFPDGSCEYIFNEHFLEHIDVKTGVAFLRECYRVLKPGGVLRIAMPSLTETIRQYQDKNWRDWPWLKTYGYTWIETPAELINICFREWDHQWLYDREELHRRLREAQFVTIHDVNLRESEHVELRGRESRDESVLICEAVR